MAVEGKTILQTTERTELTGKEGIPFQEGTQNGHVLVERLKEYVGEGLVKEDGLKTINGEKLTGIGDITFESDAGKPVILRYPKYNETSDDSTILEKANSGEWFCTLTATKAKKYFTPFLTLCFIDILCCVVIPIPVFSMLWTAYCIFCEFVSVREKSWQKEELRKAEKTMRVIIDNKDEIAKMAAELLFQRENENNTVKKEEK